MHNKRELLIIYGSRSGLTRRYLAQEHGSATSIPSRTTQHGRAPKGRKTIRGTPRAAQHQRRYRAPLRSQLAFRHEAQEPPPPTLIPHIEVDVGQDLAEAPFAEAYTHTFPHPHELRGRKRQNRPPGARGGARLPCDIVVGSPNSTATIKEARIDSAQETHKKPGPTGVTCRQPRVCPGYQPTASGTLLKAEARVALVWLGRVGANSSSFNHSLLFLP
ncbi:hypothetical protein FKP32DRAFT_115833 [Trametes sanguinea]|nr:hypothetical protein FKP32DRAFT_115833 [Trametes sanguinea]